MLIDVVGSVGPINWLFLIKDGTCPGKITKAFARAPEGRSSIEKEKEIPVPRRSVKARMK